MNQSARYLILAGGILVSFFVQSSSPASASKAASKPADMRTQAASTMSLSAKGDEQTPADQQHHLRSDRRLRPRPRTARPATPVAQVDQFQIRVGRRRSGGQP